MPRGGPIAERSGRPPSQRLVAGIARGANPRRTLSAGVQAQTPDERDAAAAGAGAGDSGAGCVSEIATGASASGSIELGEPYELGGPLRLPPKPPSFTRGRTRCLSRGTLLSWGEPYRSPQPR